MMMRSGYDRIQFRVLGLATVAVLLFSGLQVCRSSADEVLTARKFLSCSNTSSCGTQKGRVKERTVVFGRGFPNTRCSRYAIKLKHESAEFDLTVLEERSPRISMLALTKVDRAPPPPREVEPGPTPAKSM